MKSRDETIKKGIVDALCESDRIDASRVIVKVENGVVDLIGLVDNKEQREAGERIAKSFREAGAVQNHIATRDSVGDDPRSHIA